MIFHVMTQFPHIFRRCLSYVLCQETGTESDTPHAWQHPRTWVPIFCFPGCTLPGRRKWKAKTRLTPGTIMNIPSNHLTPMPNPKHVFYAWYNLPIFTYLKNRLTESGREIFHPLVPSPNGGDNEDGARPKVRARNSVCCSHIGERAKDPGCLLLRYLVLGRS